jgi:hypothetical protein
LENNVFINNVFFIIETFPKTSKLASGNFKKPQKYDYAPNSRPGKIDPYEQYKAPEYTTYKTRENRNAIIKNVICLEFNAYTKMQ